MDIFSPCSQLTMLAFSIINFLYQVNLIIKNICSGGKICLDLFDIVDLNPVIDLKMQ
jgi:hypothetical protein